MENKQDFAIVGKKGDISFDSGMMLLSDLSKCKSEVVIKDDKLTDVTEKDFDVIAILEILEDRLWVKGVAATLGDNVYTLKGDTDGRSIEEVKEIWKSYFESVKTEECWKDGKHCGDCTKIPMTCNRCMCEERLRIARKFINYFNNGDYQSY